MVLPLYLQDNLSKIPLMQKIQETARAVPEVERQQFAQHLNQEARSKAQRAQDAKEAEKNAIREKQKREERKKKKKLSGNNTAEENQNEPKDDDMKEDNSGNLIDITV